MKWIDVEKELPQVRKGMYVWAFVEEYGTIKVLYLSKQWFAMTGQRVTPTHWMPMPADPPKKAVAKKALKKSPRLLNKKTRRKKPK